MARPLRLEFPGGLYHVVVRGNERAAVFRDDEDQEKYLGRLAHYREKFGISGLTPNLRIIGTGGGGLTDCWPRGHRHFEAHFLALI